MKLIKHFIMVIMTISYSLLSTFCITCQADQSLSDGLIAYYSFDNNIDNQVDNKYDAEIINGESIYANGIFNNSLKFDGTSYMQVNNFPYNKNFSYSFWVKINKLNNTFQGIMQHKNFSRWGNGYFIRIDKANNVVVYVLSGTSALTALTIILYPKIYTWYHIVWVHDNNSKINLFYVDGQEIVSDTKGFIDISDEHLNLGFFADDPDYIKFDGEFDEFRAYNRAINYNDVLRLYTNTIPKAIAGNNRNAYGKVLLDASNSYSSKNGYISSYKWFLNCRGNTKFNRYATGKKVSIDDLFPGFYDIKLKITDDTGLSDSDEFVLFNGIGVKGDIDEDGKIGLEEAIHSLKSISKY